MSVSLFIPSRDAVYDPAGIADALSESHANEYGSWNDSVILSGSHVICRNNSLEIGGVWTGFYFDFTTPIDMSGFDRFQFAIAGLNTGGTPSLGGTGRLSIWDTGNRLAVADFTMSTDGNYTRKQFVLSDFAFIDAVTGLPVTNFNWQLVKRWYIQPGFINQSVMPYFYAWLDEGPFVKFTVVSPVLSISAEDEAGQVITYGKHAQLIPPTGGGETVMLPWTNLGRIISPGVWTVTALDDDFVNWKDGITARARAVDLVYGGTVSIVAVFQSGSTDGTDGVPDDTWIWALGLGIVSVLGVGAYIWFNRRKRR